MLIEGSWTSQASADCTVDGPEQYMHCIQHPLVVIKWWVWTWMFPKIVGFPPKSSISIRFSIVNHPTLIDFNDIHWALPSYEFSQPKHLVVSPAWIEHKDIPWLFTSLNLVISQKKCLGNFCSNITWSNCLKLDISTKVMQSYALMPTSTLQIIKSSGRVGPDRMPSDAGQSCLGKCFKRTALASKNIKTKA